MDVRFTVEGAEKTIKLLDKANSLIKELREAVFELTKDIPSYPDSDFSKETVRDKDSRC